jgi:hypothetical protein
MANPEAGISIPHVPAHHGSEYDPSREAGHMATTKEIRSVLIAFIRALEPFSPCKVVDVEGRVWDVLGRSVGRIPPPRHPFQVLQAGEIDSLKVKCHAFSTVLKSPDVSDKYTITALGDVFTAEAGHWMWLEIEVADGELGTACTLKCGAPDTVDMWEEYPKLYKLESGEQTRAYVPIATFRVPPDPLEEASGVLLGGGQLMVVQLLHTHVMMAKVCAEDAPVYIGISAPGGNAS